ncbi:MAG: hypothetical protein J6B50_07575 [Lachnospiraceae bacterium]|nr:hypothetical protein [Lachnospiraceae bacterium]MBP3506775.1 hypothetical protein [Lachnospiraceae bacterium]
MNWYYNDKGRMTKENKSILKLQLDKDRVYIFQDQQMKIQGIEYAGRLSDKVETIEYDSIKRIVNLDGSGIAVYGDIFDVQTRKTFCGQEAFRYISSCVVNYEGIVNALLHRTGLPLETTSERRKAETAAGRKGSVIPATISQNAQYIMYSNGRVLIDELADVWPKPIAKMWDGAMNDRNRRIVMNTLGFMKMDISGDDLVIICGPRCVQLTVDALATASPWRTVASNMDNDNLWKGSTWEYRIPMNKIERLISETENYTRKPVGITWWRITGDFHVTEYKDLDYFLSGVGQDAGKAVNEILVESPWIIAESGGYKWQERIAEISGKKWESVD